MRAWTLNQLVQGEKPFQEKNANDSSQVLKLQSVESTSDVMLSRERSVPIFCVKRREHSQSVLPTVEVLCYRS